MANNISLLLLPLILDVFLLFGPHIRIRSVVMPIIESLNRLPGMDSQQMTELAQANQSVWVFVSERFNLASILRTYPVGVPSLMAGQSPLVNPTGGAPIHDVGSLLTTVGWWLLFMLIGMCLGSLFFTQISAAVTPSGGQTLRSGLGRNLLQTLALTLTLFVLILAISVPAFVLMSLLLVINPALAQVGLLMMVMLAAWILVPLVFSPHGIFAMRQNALIAMLTSVRLVRFSLPSSGLFILTAFVLSQGMDMLWNSPTPDSWLVLVGIAGHAFITTALIASSFVYYRDGVRWMQELVQRSLAGKASQA